MCWKRAAVLLVGIFAGCVKPPVALRGGPFTAVTVADAQQRELAGARVRWGGPIARVENHELDTCFEVVSKPLDAAARPLPSDDSPGRFIACAPGFLDPAVYARDREVTVIGTMREVVTGKIGDFEYRFPRVDADRVYLWPEREVRVVYPYPLDPWWGYWYGPQIVTPHRQR